MQAGRLRHRIVVQKKQAKVDSFGEEVISWVKHLDAWGSIEPLRGQEYLEAKQVQADVSTRIRMRWQAGITPGMRVLYGSRVFDIQSVINVFERGRELQLMCLERIEG